MIKFKNLFLIATLLILSISVASAVDQNYNVSLYRNTLTPEVVPIQFDANWNPVNPLIYSATVHGILNTAAVENNLNYTNVGNTVNFADVTGWTIKKGNNPADLNTPVTVNDVISLTKANEPTNYTITVKNTTKNPLKVSFGLTSFYNASDLEDMDGNQGRIENGISDDTFNITLNGTYDSSLSHKFVGVPIRSGLGALISGSINYNYSISAWYMSVNGTNEWYVWLDNIDGITSDWSKTGTGWFLAKSNNSDLFDNSRLIPTNGTLEKFTLDSGESLHITMVPSSLSGNGLPTGYQGAQIVDNAGMYNTTYYPDSSTAHFRIFTI